MLIDFSTLKEAVIPRLNGGEGSVSAKMFMGKDGKIMLSTLKAGCSIGNHTHETSGEINYVISGGGKAVCGDNEETLFTGACHYCPQGASHSIINDGESDLVLFTVVCEH